MIALALPLVTLPLRLQFLMALLSALVTAADVAIRIAEFAMTVAVVVLLTVRLRFVPPVFGLSPLMVTLSAPLSWMTPKPVTGLPETDTPSATGWTSTDV